VEGVEGVLEAAAVAAPTPGGGPEQLFLFLVLRPGTEATPPQLQQQCQAAISGRLNPLFRVSERPIFWPPGYATPPPAS
jgi:acyl-coenzyme A synthetase/AMP-(fatty) acid ligase